MTASMKQAATAVRKTPFLDLSHGHSLELSVAIFSNAESWNHYCVDPTPIVMPDTVEGLFDAAVRGQRRLNTLGYLASPHREHRCSVVESMMATVHGFPTFGQLLSQVLTQVGAPEGPKLVNSNWQIDDSPEANEELVYFRLSSWYHQRYLKDAAYGNYPWDQTKALALELGFNNDDACLIRDTQREAFQHSWPHHEWMEVGLLDSDQAAFLAELRETDWRGRWSAMLADG